MTLEYFSKSKILIGLFLIALGVLSRFALAEYVGIPNFEAITAITLLAAVFLGGVWTFIVPLSIIAIKDVIIGNNSVLFFTWSAFAVIGIFGWLSRRVILSPSIKLRINSVQGEVEESRNIMSKESSVLSLRGVSRRRSNPAVVSKNTALSHSFQSIAMAIAGMTGLGIISSIFFFFYTNFGWWLISNMYPHTLDGLIQCYIMGLPFFKNNLLGNMIFVPLFSGAAMAIKYSIKNKIRHLENNLVVRN